MISQDNPLATSDVSVVFIGAFGSLPRKEAAFPSRWVAAKSPMF